MQLKCIRHMEPCFLKHDILIPFTALSKLNNVTLSSTSCISDQYYKSKSKSTFIVNIFTFSDEGSHSTANGILYDSVRKA